MKRAYSINERATEHCARMTLSNLVKLHGTPDVGTSYHESPTSSKPLSRNQRCFNQFDRKTDCFGLCPWQDNYLYRTPGEGKWEAIRDCIGIVFQHGIWRARAPSKAVCGTQTRQDGSLNKYQPDSQTMRLVAVDGGCMREAIESDNGIKRVMP